MSVDCDTVNCWKSVFECYFVLAMFAVLVAMWWTAIMRLLCINGNSGVS